MIFALPEIFLALAAMALLGFGAARGDRALGVVSVLSVLALAIAAGLAAWIPEGTGFGGALIADPFARFVKFVLFGASAVSICLAPSYLRRFAIGRVEYPVLILFATLGMSLMASAGDLLILYLGLELQSLVLYVLAALRRDHASASEAGLKYFILGALASALLLFGLSLLYGFTGALGFDALRAALSFAGKPASGALIGAVFAIVGIGFKLALVPFHLWAPDVYENVPTPVTAFFASSPKLAAFALLARLLMAPFAGLQAQLLPLLFALAAATMLAGGFGGLAQTRIKRLLAYSSIANMGAVLVGLAAGTPEGVAASLLYFVIYCAGTLGFFAVLLGLRRGGKSVEKLADIAGLGRAQPWNAALAGLFLFSLAAVPPMAGFLGKYVVFLAGVRAGLLPLVLIGVLASVASAGYYLRLVKIMFFDAADGEAFDPQDDKVLQIVGCGMAVFLAFCVFVPTPFMEGARAAAQHLGIV
jgi:NADH-quinone oxidoreductase subunit N